MLVVSCAVPTRWWVTGSINSGPLVVGKKVGGYFDRICILEVLVDICSEKFRLWTQYLGRLVIVLSPYIMLVLF